MQAGEALSIIGGVYIAIGLRRMFFKHLLGRDGLFNILYYRKNLKLIIIGPKPINNNPTCSTNSILLLSQTAAVCLKGPHLATIFNHFVSTQFKSQILF